MRLMLLLAASSLAAPASAQIFWKTPDLPNTVVVPGEAGVGEVLANATEAEQRANIAWQMRAALNVAALQCQFDKTLAVPDSYAGILFNHKQELAQVYSTLGSYFTRTAGNPRTGQQGLDRYGTRTYSSFSTIQAQYGFCQVASEIARRGQFVPRGSYTTFALENLRRLRASLMPFGEQQFPGRVSPLAGLTGPDFANRRCWRRDAYRCAPIVYG